MSYSMIHNGTLIDGNGGAPIANAAVLIEGNRIHSVGTAASIPLPDDEITEIDAQSGYIMPGFIDTHVHLLLDGIDIAKLMYKPFSQPFYESIGVFRRVLDSGVTSVRDAGGADLGVKQAIEQGIVLGPRTQISISVLMTTGGYLDPWLPYGCTFDMFPAHPGRPDAICDGIDGVRKKVREVIRAGADVVKIGATGPVFGAADPYFIQFTPGELAAIVEEAHLRLRRVMSHTVGTQGVKNAVLAGIESIEHGFYLDDEVVELMAERGTYLVPTLMASDLMVKGAEANPELTTAQRESVYEIFQAHSNSIMRAYKAGVRISMGTDEGVMPHGHSLDEMALMCKIGMQPMDIIQSATRIAAGNMGWEDRIGTVEQGKLADIVVSKVNPLTQITELAQGENIALVMKDGQIVKDRRVESK